MTEQQMARLEVRCQSGVGAPNICKDCEMAKGNAFLTIDIFEGEYSEEIVENCRAICRNLFEIRILTEMLT